MDKENNTKPSEDTKSPLGPVRTFELPGGLKVSVSRALKMKHFLKAARLVDKDHMALGLALGAVTCKFDGDKMLFEDMVENMSIEDGLKLTDELMGNVSSSSLSRILGSSD